MVRPAYRRTFGPPFTAATDQGGGVFRYDFTGSFTDGRVTVEFAAGSFADQAGNVNLAETEKFTVTEVVVPGSPPTGDLSFPTNGSFVDAGPLNRGGSIVVDFNDIDGDFDPTTITGEEISISGPGVGTAVLDGTVVPTPEGGEFEYFFDGLMEQDASVTVTFVAGTFADLDGNLNVEETESFTVISNEGVGPRFRVTDPEDVIDPTVLNSRGFIEVTFYSTADPLSYSGDESPQGDEISLGGAAAVGVALDPGALTFPP